MDPEILRELRAQTKLLGMIRYQLFVLGGFIITVTLFGLFR